MNDYKILSGRNAEELELKVKEYINDGWDLIGSHQITPITFEYGDNSLQMKRRDPKDWKITQAVYKIETKTAKKI